MVLLAGLAALCWSNVAEGSNPYKAVQRAIADVATIPEERQPFIRYLWFPNATEKTQVAAAMTINLALAQVDYPLTSQPTEQGIIGFWFLEEGLVRIDLGLIGGNDAPYLAKLWGTLAFSEPYFTPKKLIPASKDPKGAEVPEHYDVSGIPEYLPELKELRDTVKSYVPMVVGGWFMSRALQQINGGNYYNFRQLGPKRDAKGESIPLKRDDYLRAKGLNVDAINANQGIDRAVVYPRQPTGSPGSIVLAASNFIPPSRGFALAGITFDVFEEDQGNPEFDPERNLLGHKFRGQEIIVTLANGFPEYTLWDAEGNLVNEAPPNLAADKTIGFHGLPRLNPPMSCVRCHGMEDGWLGFKCRVRDRLAAGQKILGEFSSKEVGDPGTLGQLTALYTGDLNSALVQGRGTFAKSVFLVTGGHSVPEAAAWTADVFADYVYDEVTAEKASIELGIGDIANLPVQEVDDVKLLDVSRFPMNRKDWEVVYPEAATRVSALWKQEQPVADPPMEKEPQ